MSLFDHMDNLFGEDSGANGLPIVARPSLPLITPDLNLAGPEDFWSALLTDIAGENAKAIYYSLTGSELEADTVITEGHKHDAETTCEEWRELWSASFAEASSASSTSGAPATQSGLVVTETSFNTVPILAGSFTLRRGIDYIYPRIRVDLCDTARALHIKVNLYDEDNINDLLNITPISSVTAHIMTGPGWYTFDPIYVGDWFEDGTPLTRIVHIHWFAKVASGASPCEIVEANVSFQAGD